MLDNDWFDLPPPKSLDREDFTIEPVRCLSLADGAATLTAFTVHAIELGLRQLPMRPRTLFTAGGGRHNATMMHMLAERTGIRIRPVNELGWNGGAVEAKGFAYSSEGRRVGKGCVSTCRSWGVPNP